MSTSTNLPPLTPLAQSSKGKSNVRIAVITIIALHSVFFGGLLMQGCKQKTPDNGLTSTGGTTNTDTALTNSPYGDLGGTGSLGGLLNTGATNPSLAYTTPAPTNYGTPAGTPAAGGYQPTPAPNAFQPAQGAYQTPPIQAPATTTPSYATTAEPTSTSEYSVAKGDTLATIAKAHGVSLKDLQRANPNADSRRLKIGQKLTIPSAGSTAPAPAAAGVSAHAAPAATVPAETAAAPAAGNSHTVKAGDNLTKIAQKYGVSVKAIRSANALKTDRIHVGQKLKIPATGGA